MKTETGLKTAKNRGLRSFCGPVWSFDFWDKGRPVTVTIKALWHQKTGPWTNGTPKSNHVSSTGPWSTIPKTTHPKPACTPSSLRTCPRKTPPPGQFGHVPPSGGQPHAQPSHGPNLYVRATPPPPGPNGPGPTSTIPPPHQQQPQQQPGTYGPPQGIHRGVPIQQQQQPPPPQHVGPPDGTAAPPRAPSMNAPA